MSRAQFKFQPMMALHLSSRCMSTRTIQGSSSSRTLLQCMRWTTMRRTPALATVRLAMLHNLFILRRTRMHIGVWGKLRLSRHRIIWKTIHHRRPIHHNPTIHHIPTIPPIPIPSPCSVMKIQMGAILCEVLGVQWGLNGHCGVWREAYTACVSDQVHGDGLWLCAMVSSNVDIGRWSSLI